MRNPKLLKAFLIVLCSFLFFNCKCLSMDQHKKGKGSKRHHTLAPPAASAMQASDQTHRAIIAIGDLRRELIVLGDRVGFCFQSMSGDDLDKLFLGVMRCARSWMLARGRGWEQVMLIGKLAGIERIQDKYAAVCTYRRMVEQLIAQEERWRRECCQEAICCCCGCIAVMFTCMYCVEHHNSCVLHGVRS